MRGKYKNSIYYMIIGIIICGSMLFMISYGVFMQKNYLIQYNGFVLDSVTDTYNQLSRNLSYMNNTVMKIKMSDEVNAWTKAEGNSDIHLEAINVQKRIKHETIYNNDLKFNIAVTFLEGRELVVTNNLTSQKYLYFNQMGITKEEVDNIYSRIKAGEERVVRHRSINSEKEAYIHYFSSFAYADKELLYITSINEQALSALLQDDRGAYYVLDNNGSTIGGSVLEEGQQVVWGSGKFKEITSLEGERVYAYKDKRIIFKDLQEIDWILAYVYEPKVTGIGKIITGICLIGGIALLVALLLGRLMTNRLYRPVKELLEEMRDEEQEEETSHNEFEYISSYNKKMQEDKEALCEVIAQNKGIIKEKFYKELLNGIKASGKEEYEAYGMKDESMRVLLIEFDTLGGRLEDEETFMIKQSIKMQTLPIAYMEYTNIDYKTCVLILKSSMEIQEIRKTMLQIINKPEIHERVKIKVAVGNRVDSLGELQNSFIEAKKIMEHRNAFPNKLILTHEDIEKLEFNISVFPVRTENKLITGVVHGEKEILELLEDLIIENLMNPQMTLHHKKNFVLAMIVAINRIFDQMSVSHQSYLGDVYVDYTELYEKYNDKVPMYLRRIFETIIAKVKEQEVQSKKDMSEQMLEYIYTNYPEDIMLEDMAATLNISVKYCSVLFKRVTGENFKTVLNQYRIEKAKEFLEDESVKVSEVATWVGFNSPNTFIRVFNKYVGMSPGIYQEQNAERA